MSRLKTDTASALLAASTRIVVKIGSALLVDKKAGAARGRLANLAAEIAALRIRGAEILIVSSGAIALGQQRLSLGGRLRLDEKQAAAAVGQALMINAWQTAFDAHGLVAAQLLLTLDDTENRRRYLNARATLSALLDQGAVPIINENDTVATAEIRYGDNDRLAAHAAQMSGASLLVLLSDIDGLYTADPRSAATAQHVPHIVSITPEVEAMAGGANIEAGVGSGGMASKLAAAKIAAAAGAATIIARGDIDQPLSAIADGGRASVFAPTASPARARALWISGRLKPMGTLTIDDGAVAALQNGASLLPAGVTKVEGAFNAGDAVAIKDAKDCSIAKGLIAFDAGDAARIIGKSSHEIEAALGYRRRPELVHRDNLVLTSGG